MGSQPVREPTKAVKRNNPQVVKASTGDAGPGGVVGELRTGRRRSTAVRRWNVQPSTLDMVINIWPTAVALLGVNSNPDRNS